MSSNYSLEHIPESFKTILQKLYKVDFQGTGLEIAHAIQLYSSADLQVAIISARNNIFYGTKSSCNRHGLLYQKQPKDVLTANPLGCPNSHSFKDNLSASL